MTQHPQTDAHARGSVGHEPERWWTGIFCGSSLVDEPNSYDGCNGVAKEICSSEMQPRYCLKLLSLYLTSLPPWANPPKHALRTCKNEKSLHVWGSSLSGAWKAAFSWNIQIWSKTFFNGQSNGCTLFLKADFLPASGSPGKNLPHYKMLLPIFIALGQNELFSYVKPALEMSSNDPNGVYSITSAVSTGSLVSDMYFILGTLPNGTTPLRVPSSSAMVPKYCKSMIKAKRPNVSLAGPLKREKKSE